MSVAPWEFVNNAMAGSDSLEGYSTFLTNRTLSSNPKFFGAKAFDLMNSLEWSSVPEDIRALITANLIKKLPRFQYKYVKNGKVVKNWQDEDVQMVMLRVGCNEDEAMTYIEKKYITEEQIEKWKAEGYYK